MEQIIDVINKYLKRFEEHKMIVYALGLRYSLTTIASAVSSCPMIAEMYSMKNC